MVRIPLTILYYYNRERGLYELINTHHTITIAEYEALEGQRDKECERIATFVLFLIIAMFTTLGIVIFSVV